MSKSKIPVFHNEQEESEFWDTHDSTEFFDELEEVQIMNMLALNQIENHINRLSLDEQLWLMERLIHRIRENRFGESSQIERELLEMANDPEIRAELEQIEEDFAFTELDGLDNQI
ncbi:MAG: hypothetical protein H6668_11460 [Ardenticatenaceae bacterium]|nr:hypothetical protein [Ardenticatenaceae bacterium]